MKKIISKIYNMFSLLEKEKINAMTHCGNGFN
jgi:hypothetical protein